MGLPAYRSLQIHSQPFAGETEELYDMKEDPEELVNLAMKEANLPLLRNFGGGQSTS